MFAAEPLKYMCNVNVLTTGFDAPRIDCVVMLRPTMSPGLLVQCVGRGFRLHPDKQNCLVLDFGGNIERHGPIDQVQPKERKATDNSVAPAKACPHCHTLVATGYATCPDCGFTFPPPDRQTHNAQASNHGVLSGEVTDAEYDVRDVVYSEHRKRGAPDDAPSTMKVTYTLGLNQWHNEFICFEHDGYARQQGRNLVATAFQ